MSLTRSLPFAVAMVESGRTFPISGAKLRAARLAVFLSQEELAARTNGTVTAATIKRIEQAGDDETRSFASTVRILAKALEISPTALMPTANTMKQAASPQREPERGRKPKR